MLTANDHDDLGTLLRYALQPTQRPGQNPEYKRVLARYRSEGEFKTATDAVLHGLGARALADGDFGLVLGVDSESPFAFRMSDMTLANSANPREGRLLSGLILVAIAAYIYPNPHDLDDTLTRRLDAIDFEAWLRAACERLKTKDGSGEVIPEQGLDDAWRVYLAMPATMVGDRGRGSGRLSPACTAYWVRRVAAWLVDQGMAKDATTDTNREVWTLTERFRVHVRDMASEPAYRMLADIARQATSTVGGQP
jgi:hypothetical protein